MLDLRIDNAKIFDGENFHTDSIVGVRNGVIAAFGPDKAPAVEVLDAENCLLAPTFVDTHSHADFLVNHDDNDGASSISQGVGTLVVGNCGLSSTPGTAPFPLLFGKTSDRNLDRHDHLEHVRDGLSLNIGELLGHNALRMSALGEAREATSTEILNMRSLLSEYLESGWLGLSVGLNYPEAEGYNRRELLALCKSLALYGRPLTCHIRDQGAGILASMREVIDVTKEAGCPVLLSHLRPLSDRLGQIVPAMEKLIDENDHVHFDMYPYVAGCTTLAWFFQYMFGGAPSQAALYSSESVDVAIRNVCIHAYNDVHVMQHRHQKYVGRRLSDIALSHGNEPGQVTQTVYLEDPSCVCIYDHQSTQENVDRLIQHDRCLIGSDAWLYPARYRGACHPRNFAAFTGFLTRYVRHGPVDLRSGLRRITSAAADYFKLDAGRLAIGKRADMVLFDLDNLQERADFVHPYRLSSGVHAVWLSGRRVYGDRDTSGNHPSRPGLRLQPLLT